MFDFFRLQPDITQNFLDKIEIPIICDLLFRFIVSDNNVIEVSIVMFKYYYLYIKSVI